MNETIPSLIYHISSNCPECGSTLRLKTARNTGEYFLGCSSYPACHFAENYDKAFNETIQLFLLRLDTYLKKIIVKIHPDKWPNNRLAHEATLELNHLRTTIKKSMEKKS